MKSPALAVRPIPVSGIDHPDPPAGVLPRHEFSMGFIAPKGSGKTTCLINLLSFYKGFFNNIIVFSPTVKNDEKWVWLKKQPVLGENKKLKKWVTEQKNKEENTENRIVHRPNITTEFDDLLEEDFSPYVSEANFLSEYDESMLEKIMGEQQKMVDLLNKHGKSKHWANRVLLVFDDLVGSSLFSGKRNNPFKMLNTNHRHYSFSILMVSQAYKEIPKTVRTQFSCLIVFEIPNENEVKVIYEENPMSMKYDDWLQVYNHCTEGDHNFMYINYQTKEKTMRIMKNFNDFVFFKK